MPCIIGVATADPTPFTNYLSFNITEGNTGIGRHLDAGPVWFEGDDNDTLPGFDFNSIHHWTFTPGAFTPIGDDPLVLAAGYTTTSTIEDYDDAGNLLGTLSLAGTGMMDIDLNFDAAIVDEDWSSQIYTPYRLIEEFDIVDQTGTFEGLQQVGDWTLEVRGRSARPLFKDGVLEQSTTNSITGATSTYVMQGMYDWAANEEPAPLDLVVSPRSFANAEAPNVANLEGTPSYRFQQVYSAEDFAVLGEGPHVVTRIDWRPGAEMEETLSYFSERFIMKFATTAVDPGATESSARDLDPIWENNIDGNEVTVFDGPVTLTTENSGPAAGPKDFDYGLDLQVPYVYDPSQGNILMDLVVLDGQGPLLLDFTFSETETTRFQWSSQLGWDTAEAEAGQVGGHVLQFTVDPNAVPYDCDGDGGVSVGDLNCTPTTQLASTLLAADLRRGDVNGDGGVDFQDFLILSANFSTEGRYTDGDLDGDGQVQFSDFLVLSEHFGAVAAQPVPEPRSSLSILIGLFAMANLRRLE